MDTFQQIKLIKPIQQALADEKYESPTPIQAQTIPKAISGRDILGCAQTGTGKTAAFAIPILNRLGQRNRKAKSTKPFALVLAPTRELAIQINDSIAKYGKHLRLRQALVYGGVSQNGQVRVLKKGAHILVATPGRLLDLMNQGFIKLDELEVFVLDEADRMLDMGFLPDLKKIIAALPRQRQSLFFSATLSASVVDLSNQLLNDPISVNVTPESPSVDKIEQQVMFIEKGGKNSLLQKILNEDQVDRCLVFTKTKRTANTLAERLVKRGFRATAIHGNKSQNARQRALESFRKRRVKILVATDVASRGIDIDGITHVINYDMPDEAENYVHRIGRTGRAGAEGIAISFCSGRERNMLRSIERLIGQKVPLAPNQAPRGANGSESEGSSSPSRRPRKKSKRAGRPGKAERAARREAAAEGASNTTAVKSKPKHARYKSKKKSTIKGSTLPRGKGGARKSNAATPRPR